MRTSGWTLALLLVAAPTLAAEPRAQGSFGSEETVVAVEIPVQVLEDGVPVRGLSAENFEVLEGRKARQIVGFEVVDLSTMKTTRGRPVAAEEGVVAAGRRHFLMLFDLSNSSPLATSRAREAARNLVKSSLHPSDLVAVATWSFSKGPNLVLGFTSDRRQVGVAIDSLGLVELMDRGGDPLALTIAWAESGQGMSGVPPAGGGGGIGEAVSLETLKDFAIAERAMARQTKQTELASLTAGYAGLARLMSNVLGRKYVVLLSQGFDSSILTGSTDANLQQETNEAVESGEVWRVDSNERFGDTRSVRVLDQMIAEFRRSDCTIQAVDIGGLAAGATTDVGDVQQASGKASLHTMASDTGGNLYENFNDLGTAMEKMLQATSVTYVLTIQPEDLKLDGKFHELKVKLREVPGNPRLVHRPGYYAPKPYSQLTGAERQLSSAQALLSGAPGGTLAGGMAVAAFRGQGGRQHISSILEVDGPSLLSTAEAGQIKLALFVYAFDADGTVMDFVTQSLGLDAKQVGAKLAQEPLRFVADLRVPAGWQSVRALVRAGEKGAYWLGSAVLEVPSDDAGALAASAVVFPEPMTYGLVARAASSAEKTKGLAFPYTRGADFFLPAVGVQVRKGAAADAVWNIYGLDDSEIELHGELVDAEGRPVPGASVQLAGRSRNPTAGFQSLELKIQPGEAAAGAYTVRISATQGGRKVESSAELSVVL